LVLVERDKLQGWIQEVGSRLNECYELQYELQSTVRLTR
jgi:hypothetical protein